MPQDSLSTIAVAAIAAFASLIGALLVAAVALRTSAKNIKIDNITKERAKWRDDVRKKALEVHQAAVTADVKWLSELVLQFTTILNPRDAEDRAILQVIVELRTDKTEPKLIEFAERIALLLKHDWERAKREASPFWRNVWPAKRVTYNEFKKEFPSRAAMTISPQAVR